MSHTTAIHQPKTDDSKAKTEAAKAKRAASSAALKVMLKPISGYLFAGRALSFLSALLAVAPYWALTRIGDDLLSPHLSGGNGQIDTAALWGHVKFLVGAFCTQLLLYVIALLITHLGDVELTRGLTKKMLTKISHAPLSWFSNSTSGRIRKAVQDDAHALHALVAHAPVETTAAIATPLVLLGYAFTLNWRLGLVAMATYPIYITLQLMMVSGMGEKTAEMDAKLEDISEATVEFAEGIEVVKNFGRTGQAHKRFTDASSEFHDFYWDWCGPLLRISAVSIATISIPILMAVNLGLGAWLYSIGAATVPQVLVCSLIALIVPISLQVMETTVWAYQLAGHAALRLTDLLSIAQVELPEHSQARPGRGEVSFEDVSFSYSSDGDLTHALQNVSLTLEPGTITALIGASGSGKSTLATMLARFQDPDSGSVKIDGVDLRDMSEEDLYSRVSFVLQETQLPRISIADNIRLARPDASLEQVKQAAKAAQIYDDICELPRGFDTVIDEDTSLSGGQKQRIAIARAIMADTPILVLDEATAATDPDCEAEIQRALNNLVAGRTVLVIAHHIEAIRGVDRICILSGGHIVADGPREQVATHPYWQMMSGTSQDSQGHTIAVAADDSEGEK